MKLDEYLNLITSQHKNSPRFVETVAVSTKILSAAQELFAKLPEKFDVDNAVGVQLDAIGLWVGRSRRIALPLDDVFFTWDDGEFLSTGWDAGIWRQNFDVSSKFTSLDDETYRKIIYAKIALNSWDGTKQDAVQNIFQAFGGKYYVIITDHQDMTISYYIAGEKLSNLDKALITNGYLMFKPIGVRIREVTAPPLGGKLFAWDIQNEALDGWDAGNFGAVIGRI